MNTYIDPPILPPELTSHIIDGLRNDKATLINTSLVSHTFLLFGRPHLFRALKVPPAQKPMQTSGNQVIQNPDYDMCLLAESAIVLHVRDLNIELSRIGTAVSEIIALTTFLKRMTRLEAFTISSSNHRAGMRALPPHISSAIFDILRTSPIISVKISQIHDFPYLLLGHCHFLKKLTLDSPLFIETPLSLDEFERTQDLLELETLEVIYKMRGSPFPIGVITHPHSPLGLSKLVQLKIHSVTSEDYSTWQQLIDTAQKSLRNFELYISGSGHFHTASAASPNFISFNSCLRLRRLSFHVQWPLTAPFSWLMGLLDTVHEDNCVEEIVLNLGSSKVSTNNWQELDSILAGPKFERLKTLLLAIPPFQLERAMPFLNLKGVVRSPQGTL